MLVHQMKKYGSSAKKYHKQHMLQLHLKNTNECYLLHKRKKQLILYYIF